jgi:sugar lactone lactonase YvrE
MEFTTVLDGLDDPFTGAADARGRLWIVEAGKNRLVLFDPKTKKLEERFRLDSPAPEDLVAVALHPKSGLPVLAARQTKAVLFPPDRRVEGAFREPHDVAASPDGKWVYISDVRTSKIWRLGWERGAILELVAEGFSGARAVGVGPEGTLFVVEREGNRIVRLDLKTGARSTVAGTGRKGNDGDGGSALAATFDGPKGIVVDRKGRNLYVADTENHAIRRIDLTHDRVSRIGEGWKRPHGVFLDRRDSLYVVDSENGRVVRVANPERG